MLNISIRTTLHHTDAFVTYDEYNNLVDVDIKDLPEDFINKKSGKYDAYSFMVLLGDIESKNRETLTFYYQADAKKNLFFLLKYLQKHCNKSCEIFDYWCAHRRGNDYYLELVVESVNKKLTLEYTNLVAKWCRKNSKSVKCEEFEILSENISSGDNHETIDIPIENIMKVELSKKPPQGITICWDTEFPEFEGAGSDTALAWIGIGLSGIIALMDYYRSTRESKKIKKYRKEIFSNYKIRGSLLDPDLREEHDEDSKRIYRFTEIYNNVPVAYYIVKIKKPHTYRKKNYSITKENIV